MMLQMLVVIAVLQMLLVVVHHAGMAMVGNEAARPKGIRLPHAGDKDRHEVYAIPRSPETADDRAAAGKEGGP